jgi:PAS domain S-box-containing protein
MLDRVFPGATEMAQRMRRHDWASSTVGPVESWPVSLQTAVSICLGCAFPIVLYWGPEFVVLYNDEYCPMLGSKHPAALGERGKTVWAEIWDVIEPMLRQVVTAGQATRSRDLLLHIDREGYAEEAYFSFSFSPIHHEDGAVGGIFCPVIETTQKVIGERRLRTLRDLAAGCKGAETESAAYTAAARVLADNPRDIPFALIYRVDETSSTASLEAAAGVAPGAPAAPTRIAWSVDDEGAWSLGGVTRTGRATLLDDLGERFDDLPRGAWGQPPHRALVLPVQLPGQERPRAVLVAAVSPMRALDEDHRTFFGLVATQIASGLADGRALEEERRRAEALAEIDRAKTAFFSNVSHELRTPLTLLLGPLEDTLAGAQGPLPESAAVALDVAHRNGLRLLKLVNTLLDFSRIEAGRVEASYEPTDLAELTTELAAVFRSAVEKAGLRLVVDCPPLQEPAYVDRDMWEKIVLNLLSNAFKFTFEGEIAVGLRAQGEDIELTVRDTGAGIAESDLPRMFQRFHRIRNVRSRTHEGTGIGLALVQELARLHGGEVSVRSREGEGSTFTVRIPAGAAHLPADRIGVARERTSTHLGAEPFLDEAMRSLPADAIAVSTSEVGRDGRSFRFGPHATAGRGPRILVADDNADMRDYLVRLLAPDHRVESVADGQAALERIRADAPDLVLTDVMMPRLDGFGLLAAIRKDERTRALPVIVLSARAGEESRIEGLASGADDYLIKPFSARELLARVGSQLALARLRREGQQAMRLRMEQFATLMRQAPIGVFLLDSDLVVREANPAALPSFGEAASELVGRPLPSVLARLMPASLEQEIVASFRRVLETGEPHVEIERAVERLDRGVTEFYEWRVDRIALTQGGHGVVWYFRDISAQVAVRHAIEESREALREADRRKDEFLATLAHELRTPLAPIRNALHLLQLGGGTIDASEGILAMMERQVGHMVRLVDDLMEVSRITRGSIALRKEQVSLTTVVSSAVETSAPAIEAGRHHLVIDLPPEALIVEGDPVRLAQVFVNLLDNAAKYTPESGDITLSARREGAQAIVSVRDTGDGISAEALPRVFDLFMQAERTYDRAQGGLGIGLTLVRSLVHMHGGAVEARSDGPGRGSTFSVRLPLAKTVPARDLEDTGDEPSAAVGRRRILVVDDNRDAAESLSMLLRFLGAEVDTVHDGPSALEVFASDPPSLALLDIGMPGMDGYELARKVRQLVDGGDVMLVALSGWGQDTDRRRSRDAGFDHHLVKPVDLDVLKGILASTRAKESV